MRSSMPPTRPASPAQVRTPGPTPRVPFIICPECAAVEPSAFIGETSGDVVRLNTQTFADQRGFLYCRSCFVVWRALAMLPPIEDLDPAAPPRTLFAIERAGLGPGFNPNEAKNVKLFKRLAALHFTGLDRSDRRLVERLNDAIALCNVMSLPTATREAVLFHVEHLNTRANLRALCNVRFESGTMRSVRNEAITIATVRLVCERQLVARGFWPAETMAEALGVQIDAEELTAAYHACSAWFGAHLWRDGPEDHVSFPPSAYKEKTAK